MKRGFIGMGNQWNNPAGDSQNVYQSWQHQIGKEPGGCIWTYHSASFHSTNSLDHSYFELVASCSFMPMLDSLDWFKGKPTENMNLSLKMGCLINFPLNQSIVGCLCWRTVCRLTNVPLCIDTMR